MIGGPVASAQDFNLEAQLLVAQSLRGPLSAAGDGQHISGLTDGDIGRLAPGQKAWQLRTPVLEEDTEFDNNATYQVCGVEVTVLRCLHLGEHADDENLYRQEEMLFNQSNLMSKTSWRGLSTVQGLVEGPVIEGQPERDGNVISYTVSLSVRLNV